METYQVIVVGYPAPWRPNSWWEIPAESVELGELYAGLCLPIAKSFARSFNLRELEQPKGGWAVVRAEPSGEVKAPRPPCG